MLELTGFHVITPCRGAVLQDINLVATQRTITAIVGRSGSGCTTLIHALAGSLPPRSRVRGAAVLNGRRIDDATPDELVGSVLLISDAALPGGTVADALRDALGGVVRAEELGLENDLSRRISALPLDARLRVHCATLMATDAAAPPPLVLVDRVLGAASAATRAAFCSLLDGLARAGSTVVWAEHDLDAVWEHAHQVVELVGGRVVHAGRPQEWEPISLPEPTLLTLSRALALPPGDCRTGLTTWETLQKHGVVLPLFPARAQDGSAPTGPGIVIDAARVGLVGPGISIRVGECVGIVELDGRPEALARRLVGSLPRGDVIPSQLPGTLRVGAAARNWERRHGLAPGSIVGRLQPLDPAALVADLSPAGWAAFRLALAADVTAPLWLPHPQAGLDPRERHTLSEDLRRPSGTRIITSRDVEFLVRACHRLVVVQGNEVVGDGSPGAVANLLETPPLISRAVGSTRYLRLTDVLESTRTEVSA